MACFFADDSYFVDSDSDKFDLSVIRIFSCVHMDSVIMGMLLAVNVDKQPMLPMVEDIINKIWHNPADAFFTGKAMERIIITFCVIQSLCNCFLTDIYNYCLFTNYRI